MMMINDYSWTQELKEEFSKEYMLSLKKFLENESKNGKIIYPDSKNVFAALDNTPIDKVKVVILGQDPYHGEGQAHGLSFSVPKNVKVPPSLQNIFKELKDDLNIPISKHGNLLSWAKEGVLLLNSVLTVEKDQAGSHQQKGWEAFTDKIIEVLNSRKENLVFILWGAPAQKKARIVDSSKHFLLKAPHPSPLSSYRGFFGSKPFSKTNNFLLSKKMTPINWEIFD